MALRTAYGSQTRDLTAEETALLRRFGCRKASEDQKRLFLAMRIESLGTGSSADLGFTEDELEALKYYLTYPEESTLVLNRYAPRTQSYNLFAAAQEHFLLRNHGRTLRATYYTGPRRAATTQ